MKSTKILLFVIVMLTLAALACGPLGQSATPAVDKSPTTAAGGKSPTQEPTPSVSEPDLVVSSLSEGLTTMKSYRAKMSVTLDGKDEQNQPVKASMQWSEEFIREPRARHIVLNGTSLSSGKDESFAMELFILDKTQYMIFADQAGKKSCISSPADTESKQGLFSPDDFGGVSGAKYVKTETVNGVKAKRYTWKDQVLTKGFTVTKGDVWVAVDGSYIVKYVVEATGTSAELLGVQGQAKGTMTLEYNVTDIGQSFKIELPADSGCQAATDIPIMKDATDMSTFGEMITYTSPSSFEDVVNFYKDEMPNNGWEASGDSLEMEGFAQFEFTKDTRKAQIMISFDQDKDTVSVLISIGE